MSTAFQRRGLRKAAEALGGEVQLRQFLDVSSTDLFEWLRNREAIVPDPVMRKVINLLADVEAGIPPKLPGSPDQPVV